MSEQIDIVSTRALIKPKMLSPAQPGPAWPDRRFGRARPEARYIIDKVSPTQPEARHFFPNELNCCRQPFVLIKRKPGQVVLKRRWRDVKSKSTQNRTERQEYLDHEYCSSFFQSLTADSLTDKRQETMSDILRGRPFFYCPFNFFELRSRVAWVIWCRFAVLFASCPSCVFIV